MHFPDFGRIIWIICAFVKNEKVKSIHFYFYHILTVDHTKKRAILVKYNNIERWEMVFCFTVWIISVAYPSLPWPFVCALH